MRKIYFEQWMKDQIEERSSQNTTRVLDFLKKEQKRTLGRKSRCSYSMANKVLEGGGGGFLLYKSNSGDLQKF